MSAYITTDDIIGLGYDLSDPLDATALNNICEWASRLADNYCLQTLELVSDDIETHIVRVRGGIVKIFPKAQFVPMNNIKYIKLYSTLNLSQAETITAITYFEGPGCVMATTVLSNGTYLAEISYSHGWAIDSTDPQWKHVKDATVLIAQPLLDDFFFAKMAEISGAASIKQGTTEIKRKNVAEIPHGAQLILNNLMRVR